MATLEDALRQEDTKRSLVEETKSFLRLALLRTEEKRVLIAPNRAFSK